jgi:hypothetical protein
MTSPELGSAVGLATAASLLSSGPPELRSTRTSTLTRTSPTIPKRRLRKGDGGLSSGLSGDVWCGALIRPFPSSLWTVSHFGHVKVGRPEGNPSIWPQLGHGWVLPSLLVRSMVPCSQVTLTAPSQRAQRAEEVLSVPYV